VKTTGGKFFFIGVLIGGTILFSAVNFQKFVALAETNTTVPVMVDNFPRLIATEPARMQEQNSQDIFTPPSTPEPVQPTQTIPSPTVTPLFLANEQTSEVIGYSVKGLPLEVYTFGSGNSGRMIVAGIHGGDEWNTVTLANQMIAYVNQYPDILPADVTLYILRNLNPDGEVRSHDKYGRLNSNGVDLNRNFPANWQADWDKAGCWNYLPTSGGSEAGSEPETRAVMEFIANHDIEALISYHSAALGIFPGGEPWDEASVRLAEAIAGVGPYRFPPIDTGCVYTGTLADYAVSAGIPAADIELTNHSDTDFDANLNILEILLTFQP
jgi:hypothetical protein